MGNLVEELVRIVHGGGSWVECAGVDELAEDREVILEMSFDGKGLDLLELCERGAFGNERDSRLSVSFWVRDWGHLDSQ